MLAIQNFPNWMKGDFYNTVMEMMTENPMYEMNEMPEIKKKLKTDLIINTIHDIFDVIDTCHYIGVEVPNEVYNYALENYSNLSKEIENITKQEYHSYEYFMTTPEYIAINLCVKYMIKHPMVAAELFTKENEVINDHYKKEFINYAIIHNSLILVKFLDWKILSSNCCNRYKNIIMRILITTAIYGRIEIMKFWSQKEWFNQDNTTNKKIPMQNARSIPNRQRFEMPIQSAENQRELCMYAAAYGQLEMLIYLHETLHFEWDDRTFESALYEKKVDCIRYLVKNKFTIAKDMMQRAIKYKYSLESIRILVEEIGISTNNPMYSLIATENAMLDIIVYLHEKNAPWHIDAVKVALQNGLVTIAKYCIENGAPYHVNDFELYYDSILVKTEWIDFISKDKGKNMNL
jgi:hypothetical protein